jgi:phospholipid N-methyltransferase
LLRQKWHEVPAGDTRVTTSQLLLLSDVKLLEKWYQIRTNATSGPSFDVRGWYHLLYCDVFNGKKIMDVGSGLGIDGITFAEHGASVTFVDIVESNLEVLKRICRLRNIKNVRFCYLETLDSLSDLPRDYDVIWCQGSLINAPFEITREETLELLSHLPIGGRWIELAYPEIRWVREGKLPFNQWGDKTDGGAPWIEWYDLSKLKKLLSPAEFDVVLSFNFHNDDFNWFDLVRTK